jgi:intracellular multiplication protein IcmB
MIRQLTKIGNVFLDAVDACIAWFSSIVLRQTVESYTDLETAENHHVFVMRDGSLATLVKINGITGLMGKEEFESVHQRLWLGLQAHLVRPGHRVHFVFERDPDAFKAEIDAMMAPSMVTAKNLKLSFDDLFTERKEVLERYCASETCYIALITTPNFLTKEQHQSAMNEKKQFYKNKKIPFFRYAQNVTAAIPDLNNTHEALVRSVCNEMSAARIYVSILGVHHALWHVRRLIDDSTISKDWRPSLPGDPIPQRFEPKRLDDCSFIMYPPLVSQLFSSDPIIKNLKYVNIGARTYAFVFVTLFPIEVKPFREFMEKMMPNRMPWRLSFHFESNGLAGQGIRNLLAAILGFTAVYNRLLVAAVQYLRDVEVNGEDAIVRFQLCATTWAPIDDERLLRTRLSLLVKTMQSWGNMSVAEVCGDSLEALISSIPLLSMSSPSPAAIAPLADVIYMLPLERPTSFWIKGGALIFRSLDGKIWPFQPGSSLQTTWVDLIYAKPGSGKSVLSSALNLGLCLSAGVKNLPRIAIIDIGFSSSGFISLVKEALPVEDRHLVSHKRLRMSADCSINPFDTQIGCCRPLSQERTMLINFLTLLAIPAGHNQPYDGMAELVGIVLDELFNLRSDTGSPLLYTQNVDTSVDAYFQFAAGVIDEDTDWHEVAYFLLASGLEIPAVLAQRRATPSLPDTVSICRYQTIVDLYSEVCVPETGESLLDAFSRLLSSSIREYPLLSNSTSFNLGTPRIIALDLDEVAKSGSNITDKQTAVMYFLSRYFLARDFYLHEDILNEMPENIRFFHKERIASLREDTKRLVMDEFHRTSNIKMLRDQVIMDMREGRKWKVQIALISQSLDDFEEKMIEFATSIYILDGGPQQVIDKTVKMFGLPASAAHALKYKVHGPNQDGATFLVQYTTKFGASTHLLTSTIGPTELWAFSTTAEDVRLRSILYSRLGPIQARRLLSRIFPKGTAIQMIEERLLSAKETSGIEGDLDEMSIVESVAEELLDMYTRNIFFERKMKPYKTTSATDPTDPNSE